MQGIQCEIDSDSKGIALKRLSMACIAEEFEALLFMAFIPSRFCLLQSVMLFLLFLVFALLLVSLLCYGALSFVLIE